MSSVWLLGVSSVWCIKMENGGKVMWSAGALACPFAAGGGGAPHGAENIPALALGGALRAAIECVGAFPIVLMREMPAHNVPVGRTRL